MYFENSLLLLETNVYLSICIYLFHNKPYNTAKRENSGQDGQG